MHPHLRARGRRRVVPLLGVVVLLVGLGVGGSASGADGPPLPGSSDLPPTKSIAQADGLVTLTQRAAVERSKVIIDIGPDAPMFSALYNGLWNRPGATPGAPPQFLALCSRGRPCVPSPFYQPPCATSDPATQRSGGYLRSVIYPISPISGKPGAAGGVDVGLLARVKVRMLSFGIIPATATVELRTPVVGRKPQPLVAHIWTNTRSGCEPSGPLPIDALVEGELVMRIDSLQVDGVPVDVGPNCRTERPTPLRLYNEGNYTAGGGGTLAARDGVHVGSIGPLSSPEYDNLPGQPEYSSVQGRTLPASTGLTIPAFTGCGTGGDDLDPVVTAMASGPNNPVRVIQSPLVSRDQGLDLDNLLACSTDGATCPKDTVPPLPADPRRPLP